MIIGENLYGLRGIEMVVEFLWKPVSRGHVQCQERSYLQILHVVKKDVSCNIYNISILKCKILVLFMRRANERSVGMIRLSYYTFGSINNFDLVNVFHVFYMESKLFD